MPETYDLHGKTFKFNESVNLICIIPPCGGRLVQVRKKVGEFGCDMYLFEHAPTVLKNIN